MMPLRGRLEELTTTGRTGSLPHMLKLAGIKAASAKKADMVSALYSYLSNPQNIINIWHRLTPCEKELMEEYIRSSGKLERSEVKEIFQKHNVKFSDPTYGGFINYFEESSPARLFFFNSFIPHTFQNILKTFIKPLEIVFTPVSDLNEDDVDEEIVVGEDFEKEFINIIKLVNNTKLKATQKSQLPTKTAVIKINEVLLHKEPLTSSCNDVSDLRSIEQTTRIYGMSKLLQAAGIVAEKNGALVVEPQANSFLKLNHIEKCKSLLNTYLEAEDINELARIREIKLQVSRVPDFISSRELILDYLAKCPINQWIDVDQLKQHIKRNDRKFVEEVVGEILVYDDYHRYYASRYQGWLQIEGRFIEVVLLEYLSALGIVDVTVMEEWDDDYSLEYFTVSYVRLTPLGAHILGINDDYANKAMANKDAGFIVQPNFEIVIVEGTLKHTHELFFDRFAEKVTEDVVSIYKLSFKAMVNAFDNGIDIDEIIDYLNKYSLQAIPENVLLTLKNWQQTSKKISIRTVTILETDDEYLMEELKSYKTVSKYIMNELTCACEIDSKSANKIKREIEKKNHFCIIEK